MENKEIGSLTENDVDIVLEILSKWNGGIIPTKLFTKLASMMPVPVIETVVLRIHEGRIQCLLIPRPDDDIVWKGMIHSPGGALRRMDYLREDGITIKGVFERVQKYELKTHFTKSPLFIGIINPSKMYGRGPEMVQVYLAKISDNAILPNGADWYDVDKLSELPNFIQHQISAINMATDAFKQIYI